MFYFMQPPKPSLARRVLPWIGVLVFASVVLIMVWGAYVSQGICSSLEDFYNVMMSATFFSVFGILLLLAPFLTIYYLFKLHFASDQGLFRR